MINTAKQVAAFAPPEGKTKAREGVTNRGYGGLALEARSDRTAKKWLYRYRIAGRQFEMQLGAYPGMELAEARERHRDASRLVEQGIDPRKHRAAAKSRNEAAWTMQEAFDRWLPYYEKTPGRGKRLPTAKTVSQQRGRWRRHLAPRLANVYVRDMTRRLAIDVLEGVAAVARIEARHCLNLLRGLLEYCEDREQIEENPIANLTPAKIGASPNAPRKRHLLLPELRELWTALDDGREAEGLAATAMLSLPVVNALKLLMLTGTRRGEVAGMRWEELKRDTWTIPAERTKSAREHKVHLAPLALELIEEQRQLSGGEYVFGSTADSSKSIHPDSLSTAVARLQGRARKVHDTNAPLYELEAFTLHDLRRSAATQWAETLLADPFLVEMMLAHAPPKLVATYNRSKRWKAQVDVWNRWAEVVADMVANEPGSNVVTLRG